MRILGKIIGAIFGYIIGGPFGLVIGFLLGHTIDAGYWQPQKKPATAQEIFFRATFIVMGNIAKADGIISPAEITYACSLMKQMQLNDMQRQRAIEFFNIGKEAKFDYAPLILELKQTCHKNPQLLFLFMEIQLEVAYADHRLTANEKNILLYLCKQFGFNPAEFYKFNLDDTAQENKQQKLAEATKTITSPYQILKISPAAQNKEVIKAYRHLLNQFHPDKLIAKGLPEEMLQFATQKTQEIRAAYEEICKLRGL